MSVELVWKTYGQFQEFLGFLCAFSDKYKEFWCNSEKLGGVPKNTGQLPVNLGKFRLT